MILFATHCVVDFVEFCITPEDKPFLLSNTYYHFVNLTKRRVHDNTRVVSVQIWIWFYATFMLTKITFITLDARQQNTDFCRIDSFQNSKLKHELNYCTHCVTLFLVPLLIVAGYADIGKTDWLLHLQNCRHSKVQGRAVMGFPHDKTSSVQLPLRHPGSLLQRRKENRHLLFRKWNWCSSSLCTLLSAMVMFTAPDNDTHSMFIISINVVLQYCYERYLIAVEPLWFPFDCWSWAANKTKMITLALLADESIA